MKLALGLVMTVGIAQLVSGCVAHAGVGGEVVVADPEPQVVYVAPGVWVVENHHTAVFYSDGYYWRRSGATWYRSRYYDDGFVVVHNRYVPRRVYGVRGHRSYVRYRARSNARRARAARRHNRAVRRDNRRRARDNRRDYRQQQRQDRRDYRKRQRENRRDNRANRRERVRDNRANRRDNRRDNRVKRREKVRDNRSKRRDNRKDKRKNKREKRRDYR